MEYDMNEKEIKSLTKRFFTKVIKRDGCWEWTAHKHRFGYGMIRLGNINMPKTTAHRASWIIHYGEIPDGLHVLHKCDNAECTNPEHLFLGTNLENILDRVSKDRSYSPLTKEQKIAVKQLRESGCSLRSLAREFNVDRKAIKRASKKR